MLFFTDPFLISAAVIPAVVLLVYVYKKDTLEKEPPGLIVGLAFVGIFSTVAALILETVGSAVLGFLVKNHYSTLYRIIENFIIVGLSEEFSKYFLVRKKTWNSKHFNCSFDAVVYCTSVSMGFALWENIKYVTAYGFKTALVRAVTAVPGHACFGVFMGIFYGIAKKKEKAGKIAESEKYRKLAIIVPALIHGLYDYIASDRDTGSLTFFILIGAMFYISYKLVKTASSEDNYI